MHMCFMVRMYFGVRREGAVMLLMHVHLILSTHLGTSS